LLHAAPIELSGSRECWHIVDHYFPDTRLRLRRMSSVSGKEITYKFTQKYRSTTQEASMTTHHQYVPDARIIQFPGKARRQGH
jgi:hypothetical protein